MNFSSTFFSYSFSLLFFVAGSLTAVGCKGKGEDKTATATQSPGADASRGACDRREKEHLCSEYYSAIAKPSWIKGECEAQGVPMLPSCPAQAAAGRCSRGIGTANRTDTVFYAPMTKETVAAMCSDGVVGTP
jgi:hypothetical protein